MGTTHDLVIRNGTIVDGTGAEPITGDVAIDDGLITGLGDVDGRGREEIDARDRVVTPGFIDLHTHLDAQIGWDPFMTPITWHGITTALLGNCGVTFAPCKPADREYLAATMETVEDIPREAILKGLPWDWEDYGGYLDSVERLGPVVNVAGLVGHSAIRRLVMGERSIADDATPDDLSEIARIAGESVARGAIGFSTNRFEWHVGPDGRPIPGTFASREELTKVATEVASRGGLMQFVLHPPRLAQDLEIVEAVAETGGGRVLFSAFTDHTDVLRPGTLGEVITEFRSRGHDVNGVTIPRSAGGLVGLGSLYRMPGLEELEDIDPDRRLAAIRDPAFRAKITDAARAHPWDELARAMRWTGDTDHPDTVQSRNRGLDQLAAEAGEHPAVTFFRYLDRTDGAGLFHRLSFNLDYEEIERMLRSDWCCPGLGDAGAHVSQMMDAGWPSFFLSYWHRDRRTFNLSESIHMLTAKPARILGLRDRGTLTRGSRADLNVLDIDRVAERHAELVADFPFGARRFIQRAVGFDATICNGTVILRHDEHTGERSGKVLRATD
jgi:N-acyl-D-aspartate/D-glutamate deacylase